MEAESRHTGSHRASSQLLNYVPLELGFSLLDVGVVSAYSKTGICCSFNLCILTFHHFLGLPSFRNDDNKWGKSWRDSKVFLFMIWKKDVNRASNQSTNGFSQVQRANTPQT